MLDFQRRLLVIELAAINAGPARTIAYMYAQNTTPTYLRKGTSAHFITRVLGAESKVAGRL